MLKLIAFFYQVLRSERLLSTNSVSVRIKNAPIFSKCFGVGSQTKLARPLKPRLARFIIGTMAPPSAPSVMATRRQTCLVSGNFQRCNSASHSRQTPTEKPSPVTPSASVLAGASPRVSA